MDLILASGSPRRRTLLQLSGIPIAAVDPADIDESRRPGEAPVPYARRLALEKAAARPHKNAWTLAADTIVHIDGTLFGKPETPQQAAAFLSQLSGRWHDVTTAWCLQRGAERLCEHTTTRVRFRDLDPVTIDNYVATGESADKAGGYGIQGLGSVLVAELHGSYTNVVGLPLAPVLGALRSVGITPTAGAPRA